MKLRIVPLLLALLMLCSCGKVDEDTPYDPLAELQDYYGAQQEDDPVPLTTFTLPYHSGETWDPFTCRDGIQQTLSSLVYETMYTLDETFTPRPQLIRSAEYDPETFTYTFHVHDGVRFSDGVVMTAQDVADSLRRAQLSPRYATRLYQMENVSVQGDTVLVTLTEENRSFTALLDIPVVQSGTEDAFIPVGTGPYRPTEDLTQLVFNSAWWQSKTLPFSEIALLPYKTEEAAAYAFSSNDVHLFVYDFLGGADYLSASDDSSIGLDTGIMHYLAFNFNRESLNDPALRCAIALAIDRDEVVNACLAGHAVAAYFPLSPVSPLYPTALEQSSSVTAHEAMEALSLTDGEDKLSLRLLVNSENSFKLAAAEHIALTLNRYDFEVTVMALDWEDYLYALGAGDYDLYYGECKLSADWDLTPLLGVEGRLNYGGYIDPEMEALLLDVKQAEDAARTAAMEALCRYLQARSPIIPLGFKQVDLLLPQGAVEAVTPTAANPFYGLEHWQVHWGESVNVAEEAE
ncbi:MAG: ABC transporter substrate-binding protein [Oscillospiraceae bacterium]|nr:ABC transporter substrate-binding protein [Oscillospiraceae bacterium]